jgi:hypothetical protein
MEKLIGLFHEGSKFCPQFTLALCWLHKVGGRLLACWSQIATDGVALLSGSWQQKHADETGKKFATENEIRHRAGSGRRVVGPSRRRENQAKAGAKTLTLLRVPSTGHGKAQGGLRIRGDAGPV